MSHRGIWKSEYPWHRSRMGKENKRHCHFHISLVLSGWRSWQEFLHRAHWLRRWKGAHSRHKRTWCFLPRYGHHCKGAPEIPAWRYPCSVETFPRIRGNLVLVGCKRPCCCGKALQTHVRLLYKCIEHQQPYMGMELSYKRRIPWRWLRWYCLHGHISAGIHSNRLQWRIHKACRSYLSEQGCRPYRSWIYTGYTSSGEVTHSMGILHDMVWRILHRRKIQFQRKS